MTISNAGNWRRILREQQIANARRWLLLLSDPAQKQTVILNDYENILRALEINLQDATSFQLSYDLIQALFSDILGYADWERWRTYLQIAAQSAQELSLPHEHARLVELLASLHYHQGSLNQAYILGQKASDSYLQLNALPDYARSLTQLALYADQNGQSNESFKHIEAAQEIARAIGDDQVLAAAALSLSNLYRRRRSWQQAMAEAQRAHDLYQSLHMAKAMLRVRLTILHIWAEQGEWLQVELIAKALSQDAAVTGDMLTLCQLKNNLGIALFKQNRFKDAEKAWQEALQLQSQMHEPTELAGLYNNLGVVYTKLEEWETAETMLKNAIATYKELGDTYNWANSQDNLADLYLEQNNTTAFKETLQIAIKGILSIAENPHAANLLRQMQQRLHLYP